MKRITVGFIVLIVFVFPVRTLAADTDYWTTFMQVAATNYEFGHGDLELNLMPFEYDQNAPVTNGLDSEFVMDFGIYKNLELYGYVMHFTGYTNLISELKYQFYQTPRFNGAVMARVFTVYKDFTTPSLKLMWDTKLTDNLSLHNAFQLYFYESGVIGKHLDTAVKYIINDKHAIQTRFKIFFVESLKKSMFDFRIAYRYTLNRKTNYYCYTYFDLQNVHIENIVEFTPIPPLKLITGLIINTDEWRNNYDTNEIVTDARHWAFVKTEYSLNKTWTFSGEYRKEAAADGYSYFKVGLDLKI
jgi:hypothetical protein